MAIYNHIWLNSYNIAIYGHICWPYMALCGHLGLTSGAFAPTPPPTLPNLSASHLRVPNPAHHMKWLMSLRTTYQHLAEIWKSSPLKNPGKSGKIQDLGSGAVWGAISTRNFLKKLAQKLRRIILLHFGLRTFRFHFGKTIHFHGFRTWRT